MSKVALALACAAALASAGCTLAMRGPASGIDRAAGDPSVRAQDDFFRRVNGGWLKTAEFPADKAYLGSFEALHDRIQVELRGLVEKAVKTRANADEARIADLYESFVDEAAVERAGLLPVAGELAVIDALQSPAQLPAVIGRMARLGVGMPLRMYIDQD